LTRKGEKHNPLDKVSFGKPLLFIDGDEKDQIEWALSQEGKIILVKGAPLELEKTYKHLFFFDQGSVLVEKFNLTKVPSRISQQDKQLLIETVPLLKAKTNA